MPVEGVKRAENFGASISRIPLFRDGSQITRNYCAFWKKDNSGYYIETAVPYLRRQGGGRIIQMSTYGAQVREGAIFQLGFASREV